MLPTSFYTELNYFVKILTVLYINVKHLIIIDYLCVRVPPCPLCYYVMYIFSNTSSAPWSVN